LSNYFKTVQPDLEFVLADPAGPILAEYVDTGRVADTSGSWAVEGIGEDFIAAIVDQPDAQAGRPARHCASALALAQWLEAQPQVRRMHYPGLAGAESLIEHPAPMTHASIPAPRWCGCRSASRRWRTCASTCKARSTRLNNNRNRVPCPFVLVDTPANSAESDATQVSLLARGG
jgi:hypothetical protein